MSEREGLYDNTIHRNYWYYPVDFVDSSIHGSAGGKQTQALSTARVIILKREGENMINAVLFIGGFSAVTLLVVMMIAKDSRKAG